MRIAFLAAVAASTMFSVPASAQGNAYGQQPKVCLLTFDTAGSTADIDVVKGQYLPLAIALKLEARNDDYASIFTYNAPTQYSGVDYNVLNPVDPALGITASMNTEQVCEAFMAYADSRDDEDNDD